VKPGDLVRLKAGWVYLVQFKQRSSGVDIEPIPAGTPAVFLGTAPATGMGHLQSLIIIRGEVGHAWSNELEAV
jgi:hypothetical protein